LNGTKLYGCNSRNYKEIFIFQKGVSIRKTKSHQNPPTEIFQRRYTRKKNPIAFKIYIYISVLYACYIIKKKKKKWQYCTDK